MYQYNRILNTKSTRDDRETEYESLVAAIKENDVDSICKHSFKLYSMLFHLPEHRDIRKDMRRHYYPNMREWRKTVETHKGDQDSLDAFITIIRNTFKKFGYDL